jgi:hypothetical protein
MQPNSLSGDTPPHLLSCPCCGMTNAINASRCWGCETSLLAPVAEPAPQPVVSSSPTTAAVSAADPAAGVRPHSPPANDAVGDPPLPGPAVATREAPGDETAAAARARLSPAGRAFAITANAEDAAAVLDGRFAHLGAAGTAARRRRRIASATVAAIVALAVGALAYPTFFTPVRVDMAPTELRGPPGPDGPSAGSLPALPPVAGPPAEPTPTAPAVTGSLPGDASTRVEAPVLTPAAEPMPAKEPAVVVPAAAPVTAPVGPVAAPMPEPAAEPDRAAPAMSAVDALGLDQSLSPSAKPAAPPAPAPPSCSGSAAALGLCAPSHPAPKE